MAINKELMKARKLYKKKEYENALEIYEKEYEENPDDFGLWEKRFYSWNLYQLYVKDFDDEEKLFESVELITDLIPQSDLNKDPVCAYTLSVIKVMDYLYKSGEYSELLEWIEKINPELLDDEISEYNGRVYASRKGKYYNYKSKALLELDDYELCIESSKEALDKLDKFANDDETWFKWRIAKSLKELGEYEEAIGYLKEVSKVKKDWFVDFEFATNYYFNLDNENALKYAVKTALKPEPPNLKINVYPIIRDLISDEYPEEALKHDYLVYSIRLAKNWQIDDRLAEKMEETDFDLENKNYRAIEKDLIPFWNSLKYKNKELIYGTITRIFEHGKSGFITSEDGKSYYFNTYDIVGDKSYLREYVGVSFYGEKSFDKSKNRESLKAVNINLI